MPRALGSNRAREGSFKGSSWAPGLSRAVVPTVNSIRLARNRESGDACSHGRHAQTDLVGSHRAVPIKSFARSADHPDVPRASITLRRSIALRAAIPTPSRSKNARWRSLRRRSGGLLVRLEPRQPRTHLPGPRSVGGCSQSLPPGGHHPRCPV